MSTQRGDDADPNKRMREMEEMIAQLQEESKRAEEARKQAEEENRQYAEQIRALQEASRTAPPAASNTYRPSRDVAKDFFASTNDLRWPMPDEVKLPRARLDQNNRHAKKFNAVEDALAVPNTDTFSPLLYHFIAKGKPLSKGMKLGKFPGAGGSQCVVLLGPSGSGKTRKALELLRETKGIFISFRQANDKNPGSFALTKVLEMVTSLSHVDWIVQVNKNDPKQENKEIKTVFEKRREAVHFAMRCVLAAYELVYSEWEYQARSRTRFGAFAGIAPSKWLLVQLYPSEFFGIDVFEKLALRLFQACDPLDSKEESNSAFPTETRPGGSPCIIDEAQAFGKILENMFNTQGTRISPRPLLSAIISGAHEAMGRLPIIVGTGLSLATEWKSIASNSATDDTTRFVFHDFPPLTKNEVREMLVRLLACEEDTRFEEACEWLEGRPRWTTLFVERALRDNLSVSDVLERYLAEMADPNTLYTRGPAYYIDQLRLKPGDFEVMGALVGNPYHPTLMDAYWVSHGLRERPARSPALIEIGLAYARPISTGIGIEGVIKAEPLILEAARRFRERLPAIGADSLHAVQDSDSEMGNRFEYLAADRTLNALFATTSLEDCVLLGSVAQQLPSSFRGKWGIPPWRCGRRALSGADAFPDALLRALDPAADVIRLWFPDDLAGPDAVAIMCDVERKRVMVVLIQMKLAVKFGAKEAMLTVDPSKMYHVNRGKPRGEGKGREHAIKKFDKDLKAFLGEVRRRNAAVMRVLVSGAAKVEEVATGLVEHARGGGMRDLCVVVDGSVSEAVFGSKLSEAIRKLKV